MRGLSVEYGKKRFLTGMFILVISLMLCFVISVSFGAKQTNFSDIVRAFTDVKADSFEVAVIRARIPRTVFGIIAGASLALSGCMMQAVTRNPIADPSILGVNTGASLAVVIGMAFLHITQKGQYIGLAMLGAAMAAAFVYGIASIGRGGATPLKLALAGTAAGTAMQSIVNTIMLPDAHIMDQFRFWQVGSIGGATFEDIYMLLPYFVIGAILCVLMIGPLNTLALGEETATALGVNVKLVRACASLAGVMLCASTTALAGPIGFIGLMVPHMVRMIAGADMKKLIPASALCGSCLLIVADVIGRVLGAPGEIESGIITALLGAPVFVIVIRKAKVYSL